MPTKEELKQGILALQKIKIENPEKALIFAKFVTKFDKHSDILDHIPPMSLFLAASKNENAAKLILSSAALQGLLKKEPMYMTALQSQYSKNSELTALLKKDAKPEILKQQKKQEFKALMKQLRHHEIVDIFAELGLSKKMMLSRAAFTEAKKVLAEQILELSQAKEKNEAIKDDKPGEYASNKKAIEEKEAKLGLIKQIVEKYFKEYLFHLFIKYSIKAQEEIDALMETFREHNIPLEAACKHFFNLDKKLDTVLLKKDLRAEQLQNHPDKVKQDVFFKMITPLFELMIDPISRYYLLKKLRKEIIKAKAENVHTVNLQKGLAFFDKHKQDLEERLMEKTEEDSAIEEIESQQGKLREEPEEEKEAIVTPSKVS